MEKKEHTPLAPRFCFFLYFSSSELIIVTSGFPSQVDFYLIRTAHVEVYIYIYMPVRVGVGMAICFFSVRKSL